MPAATQDAIEAFTDRFVDAMNDAALISMASIGHRTRLFDAMGEGVERTSGELAVHAGLNERYVREWLSGR